MRRGALKRNLAFICVISCSALVFLYTDAPKNRDYKKSKNTKENPDKQTDPGYLPYKPVKPVSEDAYQMTALNETVQQETLYNLTSSLRKSRSTPKSSIIEHNRTNVYKSHISIAKVETKMHEPFKEEQEELNFANATISKNIYTAKQMDKHVDKSKCNALRPYTSHVTKGLNFTKDELNIANYIHMKRKPLIPKIVHQTWDTYEIPDSAVPYIASIIKQNPRWDYWFWTKSDIDCYLTEKHPEFVKLYNSYPSTVYKTNFIRYFILYDFGGFFMNLDISCLKSLNVWRYLGHAILSHDIGEHVFILHHQEAPNVMATVQATRPGHPFYKLLQERLADYYKACPKDESHSTGDYFVDNVYQEYLRLKRANGTIHEEDTISVIDSKYWVPTYGAKARNKLHKVCSSLFEREELSEKTRILCNKAVGSNYTNVPDKDSFLQHHWVQSDLFGSRLQATGKTNVTNLIPNFIPVHKKLGLNCTQNG